MLDLLSEAPIWRETSGTSRQSWEDKQRATRASGCVSTIHNYYHYTKPSYFPFLDNNTRLFCAIQGKSGGDSSSIRLNMIFFRQFLCKNLVWSTHSGERWTWCGRGWGWSPGWMPGTRTGRPASCPSAWSSPCWQPRCPRPSPDRESQVIATPDLMMGLSGSLEVICKYPDTDKTINHPAPVRLVILPDWIYIITAKCRCQFGQQSEACKCIK